MRIESLVVSLALLASAKASAQGPPASDSEFVKSAADKIVKSLGLRKPDLNVPLEKEINEEVKSLDIITGLTTPVWVGQGCRIDSHPSAGLIVDLDQLNSIRNAHAAQFPLVLRFLLAHEEAHQIQFRTYSPKIIDLPEDERRVYEAQADILGAKYLIETIGANGTSDNDAIMAALKVAYELGTEQYALADHPSHEARLTSARLGMAMGMIAKLQALGPGPAQGSIATLVDKLNVLPGEDVLAWSLRTARRCVNYQRIAIVDLVLIDRKIVYSKDPDHPVTSYWFTYENRGKHALSIDAEVQCDAVARDDPDDIFRWQKISVRNHHMVLPAGQKETISGALRWYGDSSLMPRVIAPPDPTALIQVQYEGEAVLASPGAGVQSLAAAPPAGVRESFSQVLDHILQQSVSGFLGLRAGAGKKLDDIVEYPSDTNFPTALNTKVWIPEPNSERRPYVRSTLTSTASASDSKRVFDTTANEIRKSLSDLGALQEDHSNTDASEYDDFTLQGIEVHLGRSRSGDGYEVTISIERA